MHSCKTQFSPTSDMGWGTAMQTLSRTAIRIGCHPGAPHMIAGGATNCPSLAWRHNSRQLQDSRLFRSVPPRGKRSPRLVFRGVRACALLAMFPVSNEPVGAFRKFVWVAGSTDQFAQRCLWLPQTAQGSRHGHEDYRRYVTRQTTEPEPGRAIPG
jgi:hypothetical protein